VAIAVFLTAMVIVSFSTLTGCRGCSSEEEETVHWVPAPRDTNTISRVAVKDVEPMVVEEIIVAKPVKNVSRYNDTYPDKPRRSNKQYNHTLWSEELALDSVELTIVTTDMEVQITQKLN
jgi:hypothetical protein